MWLWTQRTGELIAEGGQTVAHGYAGHGEGHNNPTLQRVHNVGPLPQGVYTILKPRDGGHMGPFVLPLIPNPGNQMFQRGGFYIHGDSIHFPGTASDGCIILARDAREAIWDSQDHRLKVIEGPEPTVQV